MSTKKITIVALGLIIFGTILALIGFSMGGKFGIVRGGNGYRIQDKDDKVVKQENLDKFDSIDIKVDLDNIEIIKGDRYAIELEYYKDSNDIIYKVENGKLIVKEPSRNSMINFGFNIGFVYTPSFMKVYVPQDVNLNNLDVHSSNSDIKIKDIKSNTISVKCDYGDTIFEDMAASVFNVEVGNGKLAMKNIKAKEIITENKYGELKVEGLESDIFKNVVVNGSATFDNIEVSSSFKIENEYGDVNIKNSFINNLEAKLKNGDLDVENTGSDKVVFTNNYGSINTVDFKSKALDIQCNNSDVTLDGELLGNTTIKSQYGSVTVKTNIEELLYNYNVSCEYGDIIINDSKFEDNFQKNNNGSNNIDISCKNGDAKIEFKGSK